MKYQGLYSNNLHCTQTLKHYFDQCIGCCFPPTCSGYEELITGLMSELPPDLVSYNRPVRCLHWVDSPNGSNVVEVECEDGERIAADHVIVTVPLGKFSLSLFTFVTLCNNTVK